MLRLGDAPKATRAKATIGRPYELAARTTQRAVTAFSPVREAIVAAALDGPAAVADAVVRFKGDATLEALSYESATLADLAGQMFVRLVELAPGGAERHLAQPDLRPAFLRMPFDEAVAFWSAKGGDPAILDEVLRAYRRRAAFYTDQQLDVISAAAVAEIDRTLREGGTLRDFQTGIVEDSIALGISPASPAYLENVYRTQVAGAYGAGRWAQINSPDVLAARPYRQWHTANDSRVRAEHVPMDQVVWRADDPQFASIAPPAGFQCRCVITTLTQEDVDDEGLVVASAPPPLFVLTPGFGAASFVR